MANKPSVVTMPSELKTFSTVLEFLIWKFPGVSSSVWRQRVLEKKVLWDDQTPVLIDSPYVGHQRIFYYREVAREPAIPFSEQILYQDDHLLIACKPHFLPVTPGGKYVEECLLNRLRKKTGLFDLTPVHRIDRETAGLVLLSVQKETRHCYHNLFESRNIKKQYLALAECDPSSAKVGQQWEINNRLVIGKPEFRMQVVAGEVNARSRIRCKVLKEGYGLFELEPVTGKRHQLRVHMAGLNLPLINDRYYPDLQAKTDDNYKAPLKLLAHSLAFIDPISECYHEFKTSRSLWDD